MDVRPRAPTSEEAAISAEGEHPGSLADDIAVGACAGLGGMTLVAMATMAALRAGLIGFSPLLLWYFRGGTLVLLGGGLIAAVLAETAFPRRLFALSSIMSLGILGLRNLGVDYLPMQAVFCATMLGGAVVWVRRPPEGADRIPGEPTRAAPEPVGRVLEGRTPLVGPS